MTTSIERIREQVARVREDHRSDNHPQLPYCSCDPGTKDGSLIPWPCPTLRFAEDKLKLAEALQEISQGHDINGWTYRTAERILAEVAE